MAPAATPPAAPPAAISPAVEAAAAQAAKKEAAQVARECILHLLRRDPRQCGVPRSRWTLAELAPACDFLGPLTRPGLSQLLGRVGIHYKAARDYVHSPDPDYEAKLAYIDRLLTQARGSNGQQVVLYQDELPYYRQPTLARSYEARGRPQPLARRSHAANTATRVAATLDAFTARVVPWQGTRFGIPQVVAFYQQVRAAYPEAERIYVVQDNWPVHFHPDVLVALQPQIQPWPVPTGRGAGLGAQPRGGAALGRAAVAAPTDPTAHLRLLGQPHRKAVAQGQAGGPPSASLGGAVTAAPGGVSSVPGAIRPRFFGSAALCGPSNPGLISYFP